MSSVRVLVLAVADQTAFFPQSIFFFPGGAPNAAVTQTSTIDSKIDEVGTLRARHGSHVAADLWLLWNFMTLRSARLSPVPSSSTDATSRCPLIEVNRPLLLRCGNACF